MKTIERLTDFFWLTLPWRIRRLSSSAVFALVDGAYTMSWPKLAALGSVASVLGGFCVGWLHPGFEIVFSESLILMIIVAVLGTLGAHFGLLFVFGYATGDLLLGGIDRYSLYGVSSASWVVRIFVPQLIEYTLLAFLMVSIPLLVKYLLVSWPWGARLSRGSMLALAMVGHVLLTVGLVYLWAQVVPVMARPLFTWRGVLPTTDMAIVLQKNVQPLLWAVAIASLVRMVAQSVIATRTSNEARVNSWQKKLLSVLPITSFVQEKLPAWAVSVLKIIGTLFLLSGVFQSWTEVVGIGVIIALIYAAQDGLIPVPLGKWREIVYKVPLLARLLGGGIVIYVVTSLVLAVQSSPNQGFRPTVISIGVSFLIMYLLSPGVPFRKRKGGTV
ncbi:MAG TPA: hypothetical protein VJI96_05065 [Candidatus Andersenbacteria bacterium]|nr:hypothetical protein [Candidatus Andersenbacteria bacterium]